MATTSKAQQNRFTARAGEHQQAIVKIIQQVSRSRGIDRTWSDWIEMSAIAMARLDKAAALAREERYLQIVKGYPRDELRLLVEAFAHLVEAMQERVHLGQFGDLLGEIFMMLNLGNAGVGQFFTPYEVSRAMAHLVLPTGDALRDEVARRGGFLTIMEPACGAGGMVIAAAHSLHAAGLNHQVTMHATCIDVDLRCVQMTFLQLALLHIPAQIVHGNALTMQEWGTWSTPAHQLGNWTRRLNARRAIDAIQDICDAPVEAGDAAVAVPPATGHAGIASAAALRAAAVGQMQLF